MIRPCDQCGGAGQQDHPVVMMGHRDGCGGETCDRTCPIPINAGYETETCPRCADMPWLTHGYLGISAGADVGAIRSHFRPDPSTVIQWCFAHQSRGWEDGCDADLLNREKYGLPLDPPCEIGWIPTPEPLKEAE